MSSLLADASAEDDDLCISSVYAIKTQAATGRTLPANLVVLDCLGPSLCGRDVISKLNLLDAEVAFVSAHRDNQELESLLSNFQDLFEPGLGAIEGPPCIST
ncbi:hypothetical protein HPB47_005790 [Ixodes persulcatus]|uniref:Uncharacterized protein n=1 Tax=Ixodes persulcatus TaxID=34615 RepID=A0AC60PC18_IXOPE|nr:hypothetical protein HPB47_005790 [Ixodes persulcatus]